MSKIEIFNHEDDGYQIIYINGKFHEAIHFNDEMLGFSAQRLLEDLGHDVDWNYHDNIPDEYRNFLEQEGYL